MRYRIRVEDKLGNSVTLPYPEINSQTSPNFCYNGVPTWSGSNRVGEKKGKPFSIKRNGLNSDLPSDCKWQ
ncbi:MAG: hypothetical protein CM1200mP29_01170 [Verrucomicrobiota bacterium]|nr:MAG: hypothetical protein CM1200mP29_01170 [Verrucomicrobiota bacterium]